MVLFYCVFVAMKRQDTEGVEHDNQMEDFELREREEFGGEVTDGTMRHAFRIFQDSITGVCRLEWSALRGPMQDVPIATAFVTRYCDQQDTDWATLEDEKQLSLAALRPPPTLFVTGYQLPKNITDDYVLNFADKDGQSPRIKVAARIDADDIVLDARNLIATWTGVCRTRR